MALIRIYPRDIMVIGLGNNTLVTLHTDILNIGNTFNILALGGILARHSFILVRGSFVHSDFYILVILNIVHIKA